jgi:hypothetical protein
VDNEDRSARAQGKQAEKLDDVKQNRKNAKTTVTSCSPSSPESNSSFSLVATHNHQDQSLKYHRVVSTIALKMQEKHPPLQDGLHKLSEQLLQKRVWINNGDTGMLYYLWSY